jgi:hypothetical protein
LLIAEEREGFDLSAWLHTRPAEPVTVSVITFSELWFGIEVETAELSGLDALSPARASLP